MRKEYMQRIKFARNPEKIALYIRAIGCIDAANLNCYTSAQRVSIIEEAEQIAVIIEGMTDLLNIKTFLQNRSYI